MRKRKNIHDKIRALYRKFEIEKSMPQFQARVRFNRDRQNIPINFILSWFFQPVDQPVDQPVGQTLVNRPGYHKQS